MLTQAQSQNLVQARMQLRDALKILPPSELARSISEALLVHHSPEVVLAIGDQIARRGWQDVAP